jgi:hypothetical protein
MRHVSVYARFNLKGSKPQASYISQEDWNFAKDGPLTFDILVAVIAAQLAQFHLNSGVVTTAEEINELIQKAAEQVKTIYFEVVEIEEP